jgi:hypothetical protein
VAEGLTDVAVLIPHYNNISGLNRSLSSISKEYLVDVIIVDDGSCSMPDETELSNTFPEIHSIHVISLQENCGIEYALNKGLDFIKETKRYRFIARLDCGDICKSNRFLIQRSFLENNPDIYLIGTGVQMVDTEGCYLYPVYYPTRYADIQNKMYINNMFCHPTVMFRIEIPETIGNYPMNYKFAEDYAYFFNIVDLYEVSNIPEILLFCEVNPKGISLSKRKVQLRSRIKIILNHWKWKKVALYGLIRNVIVGFCPYWLILKLKKNINGIKY